MFQRLNTEDNEKETKFGQPLNKLFRKYFGHTGFIINRFKGNVGVDSLVPDDGHTIWDMCNTGNRVFI